MTVTNATVLNAAAMCLPNVEAKPTPSLRSLFLSHKRSMLITYALFNIENILRLAQPFVLGLAIDGLLKSSYVGLLWFAAQHLAHMLIGSFRRMYDTRVFSEVYTDLATQLVGRQREQRVGVSRVAARSSLSRSFVEFFERYVPLAIRSCYSILGAVVMLAFYDWFLILFCVGLVVPAVLLNVAYSRKTLQLTGGLNDGIEREVDVIDRNDVGEVRDHYDDLARWRIRLSDAEAINFSVMELFVLATLVGTLVHFCASGSPQPGEIFAVFRYVLMFIMGIDSVPRLVEQMSRLRDVGLRMRGGSDRKREK